VDLEEIRRGINLSDSGRDPVAGSCEHGDDPAGYIKCREFLDWLRDYSRKPLLFLTIVAM
jgi:hypothetical protein